MNTTAGRNLLLLNGSKYFLDDIIRLFKKANPPIDLDIALINDEKNPAHVVTYDPPRDGVQDDVVIVLKQGSKFTVLVGKELLTAGIVAGGTKVKNGRTVLPGVRLVSTVMLKQVRVPETITSQVVHPVIQNMLTERFASKSSPTPQFRSRTAALGKPR